MKHRTPQFSVVATRAFPRKAATLAALASLSLFAATSAIAEDAALGSGTRISSGANVNAEIGNSTAVAPNDDFDDFVFDGYAGQTVALTVKKAKTGNLIPLIEVYRPDGTLVRVEDGASFKPEPIPQAKAGTSMKFGYKLDQTGLWTVRVRGSFPSVKVDGDNPVTPDPIIERFYYVYDYGTNSTNRTAGGYSLSLKASAAPGIAAKSFVADANDEFRFEIPAVGGASISGAFKFKGGAPTFSSLKDPNGQLIQNFNNAITATSSAINIKPFTIPGGLPLGTYVLTFEANTSSPAFSTNVKTKLALPKAAKPLKATFDREEPFIVSLNPSEGGVGSVMTLTVGRAIDSHAPNSTPKFMIGRLELTDVVAANTNGTLYQGKVPVGVVLGDKVDVTLLSSAGQAGVKSKAFTRVPPPVAISVDPAVGTSAGGFSITITGSNFNTAPLGMGVKFDGSLVPVQITAVTETSLTFTAPTWPPGLVTFGVADSRTGQTGTLPLGTFEFTSTAAINRVTPSLVPLLGNEPIYVSGANFKSDDQILLETGPNTGVYAPVVSTFLNDRLHTFNAPPRGTIGPVRVKIRDVTTFETQPRTYAYFSFTDFSTQLGLPGGADQFDAVTTAVADYDNDGDMDLFISRKGGTTVGSTSLTRILRNDGTGRLTDVTASVMPATLTDDDWRADSIRVIDITLDTNGSIYPDMVIATNSTNIPAALKSHVRFLINERRSASSAITDRVYRDRTTDYAPPARVMSKLYGSGNTAPDDWRGLDLFVGDLDLSAANPPEIIVTNDETKDDIYVGCAPYCASPYSGFYTYSFYWGGSRAFIWDKSARGGLGRYKFDHNYFPRKAGVTVPVFNPPPGVVILVCNGNCKGKFTPFAGQKLAVGPLDADGKPDIAVLSNKTVTANGGTISSLQVALNKFNPKDGANVTDITDKLTLLGGDYKGESIAIGQPGYPDGTSIGFIALAKAVPGAGSGSVMKILKFKPPTVSGEPGDFTDVSALVLPTLTSADRYQSSAIQFIDIDGDGDQDMVSVANATVGSGLPALRVWRNEGVNNSVGVMRETLKGLFTPIISANEHFEGDCLAIGDLDGDGALEYVVTLASTAGRTGPVTRAVKTAK